MALGRKPWQKSGIFSKSFPQLFLLQLLLPPPPKKKKKKTVTPLINFLFLSYLNVTCLYLAVKLQMTSYPGSYPIAIHETITTENYLAQLSHRLYVRYGGRTSVS